VPVSHKPKIAFRRCCYSKTTADIQQKLQFNAATLIAINRTAENSIVTIG
jgi:hypothetical protein